MQSRGRKIGHARALERALYPWRGPGCAKYRARAHALRTIFGQLAAIQAENTTSSAMAMMIESTASMTSANTGENGLPSRVIPLKPSLRCASKRHARGDGPKYRVKTGSPAKPTAMARTTQVREHSGCTGSSRQEKAHRSSIARRLAWHAGAMAVRPYMARALGY